MALVYRKPLTSRSFEIASYYQKAGTYEKSYNSSPVIDRIIRSTGGQPGKDSWCMDFVYFCFDSASKELKQKNPLLKTGSCWRQLEFAANNYFSKLEVIPVATNAFRPTVKTGDIPIWKHGEIRKNDIGRAWNGHTGIIEKADGANWITIEGNTNSKGTREGGRNSKDGVYKKFRNPLSRSFPIVAIIRVKE